MDVNGPGAALDYRRGDRVALDRVSDPDTRLRPGDEGTVADWRPAQGQLLVDWDSGSSLIMLPGEGDQVRVIGRAMATHAEAGTDAGASGRLAALLREHLGDFVLTRQAVAGFADCQGVRLVDVAVTGNADVMVVVEGQQPVPGGLPGQVRKTVTASDLAIPAEWAERGGPGESLTGSLDGGKTGIPRGDGVIDH